MLYNFLLSPGDAMTIRETVTDNLTPNPSPKGEGSEYNKAEALPVENLGGYFPEGISGGNYGLLARNIAICLLNTSIICCSWGWLRFTMSAM